MRGCGCVDRLLSKTEAPTIMTRMMSGLHSPRRGHSLAPHASPGPLPGFTGGLARTAVGLHSPWLTGLAPAARLPDSSLADGRACLGHRDGRTCPLLPRLAAVPHSPCGVAGSVRQAHPFALSRIRVAGRVPELTLPKVRVELAIRNFFNLNLISTCIS